MMMDGRDRKTELCFWRQAPALVWSSPSRLDRLAREAPCSPPLHSPSLELQVHTPPCSTFKKIFLPVGAGDQTQILVPMRTD